HILGYFYHLFLNIQHFCNSTHANVALRSTNRNVPSRATVVSQATNRALDAGGANGAEAYMHPHRNPHNNFHLWNFQRVGDDYMIISQATGRALDSGGANGAEAYMHPQPMPHNPFHLWRLQKVGDAYMIISKATGRVLDSGGANGEKVYMHPQPMSHNPFHLWKLI
ncbi:RICIN domain-containing protein, partial [Nodularia chucula]|uniref:RICIN domain-containing protein n=1 Tax=Nodularia chucula TaxID=3093667 RepID=UPI0039C6A4C6